MGKKEEFILGMTLGGILIMVFYVLLFFPVLWLYMAIPVEYKQLTKYILATILIVMLINSVRGAYQSLNIIKNHDTVVKKMQHSADNNINISSYLYEGLKYRILIEFALF